MLEGIIQYISHHSLNLLKVTRNVAWSEYVRCHLHALGVGYGLEQLTRRLDHVSKVDSCLTEDYSRKEGGTGDDGRTMFFQL